jgi:hypothetical protein
MTQHQLGSSGEEEERTKDQDRWPPSEAASIASLERRGKTILSGRKDEAEGKRDGSLEVCAVVG